MKKLIMTLGKRQVLDRSFATKNSLTGYNELWSVLGRTDSCASTIGLVCEFYYHPLVQNIKWHAGIG